jgi:hypothetical protein
VRDPTLGTMLSSRFQFFTPSTKLVERGINLEVEDVLYNYTDVTSTTRSHTRRAFKAMKEFYVITLQILINVCSPPNSIIVDFNCGMGIFFHPSLVLLKIKLFMQPFVSLTFAFHYSYME